MNQDFDLLYKIYTEDFISLFSGEDFYEKFMTMAKNGKNVISFVHRFVDKQIDLAWVEAIEDCIVPLDNIIRNPRRFIAQEEDIVPIELAKKIAPESIRHLAQHTNMIAKVEDDEVTPERILTIFKEESLETYENRFIYTLLINLQFFIDKKLKAMNDRATGENISSIMFNNEFRAGKERIKYSFELTSTFPAFKLEETDINADTSKMDRFQRVERIKKILYQFQCSPLIKTLTGTTLVRPPIMRTNVLQKNPDFKKAKQLWDFIETYRDPGFDVEVIEKNELPSKEYMDDIYSAFAVNYSMLRHHTEIPEELDVEERRKKFTPKIIERTISDMMEDMTIDLDMIKRIFTDQVRKASTKRAKEEKAILKVIDSALAFENKRASKIEAEKARIAEEIRKAIAKQKEEERIARQKKLEEEKRAKEAERLRKKKEAEAEKKRILAEKAAARRLKEKERKEKLKAEELAKKRAKAQKQKEREKLQKEKALEIEKQKQVALREKQKLQKEKALEAEKVKQAEQKQKARAKQQQQKLLEAEKAKAQAQKLKEREKVQKQKLADAEKAKAAALKEKEKIQKQKLADAEKAKAQAQKQKEKEKLQKQKTAEAEKAKATALKEKEKLQKQKVLEAEKAKAQAQKQKEKEKLRKQKAAEAEKARQKAQKEKDRLKLQKAKEKAAEAEKLRREKEKAKQKAAAEKAKAKK